MKRKYPPDCRAPKTMIVKMHPFNWWATLIALVLLPLPARTAESFDQSHARFGHLLSNCVANARVDYAGLKAAPQELDAYLSELASVRPDQFAKWPRENRLALFLNLYNAQTLRLIIDHYPLKSIRSIGVLPGAAWRQKVVRFGGQLMTLDHLENKVIRKDFQEPRIHFALVCAAVSCPPLRSEPYVGARLSMQLDDQARQFLATSDNNRFDVSEGTLWLSPIFDWYKEDFTPNGGTLNSYVTPFLPKGTAAALRAAKNVTIRFTDYDWALNERTR